MTVEVNPIQIQEEDRYPFVVTEGKRPPLFDKMSSDVWQFCIGLRSGGVVFGDSITAWTSDYSWFKVEDINGRTRNQGVVKAIRPVMLGNRELWVQMSNVEWITEEDS